VSYVDEAVAVVFDPERRAVTLTNSVGQTFVRAPADGHREAGDLLAGLGYRLAGAWRQRAGTMVNTAVAIPPINYQGREGI
jgi:hypothetical protein